MYIIKYNKTKKSIHVGFYLIHTNFKVKQCMKNAV